MAVFKTFHVAYLSPKQQVVLRLVCLNLFELYTKMYVDKVAEDPSTENVVAQFKNITTAHKRYEKITKNFPSPEDLGTTKGKLFQFDGLGMKNVCGALKYFDPENTQRQPEEVNLICEVIEDTSQLMNESMKYAYTVDDIKKIKGGK